MSPKQSVTELKKFEFGFAKSDKVQFWQDLLFLIYGLAAIVFGRYIFYQFSQSLGEGFLPSLLSDSLDYSSLGVQFLPASLFFIYFGLRYRFLKLLVVYLLFLVISAIYNLAGFGSYDPSTFLSWIWPAWLGLGGYLLLGFLLGYAIDQVLKEG